MDKNEVASGFIKCNLPIWLLNIGLVYIIMTIYYLIMNNLISDPVLDLLEPFPKLLEQYQKQNTHRSKNMFIGICIGLSVIYFLKPFGSFF